MVTQTAGVEACMATGQAGGLATHGPCATDTRAMATTTIPTATRGVHSTGGGGMCDLRSTPPTGAACCSPATTMWALTEDREASGAGEPSGLTVWGCLTMIEVCGDE